MKADNSHKMKSKKQTKEEIRTQQKELEYYEQGGREYFCCVTKEERHMLVAWANGVLFMHKLLNTKGL